LPGAIRVRRPDVERRIVESLRPLPTRARHAIGRSLGVAPDAITLPARGAGLVERLRGPLRRGLEILAYRRRIGAWSAAVLAAAPEARIFAGKALVALPVIAASAAARGGGYVYDVADLHVESGRLAHLPGPLKAYLRGREGHWLRAAAGLTAATPALADEIARRYAATRPTVVLNARPRWRSDDAAPTNTYLRTAADIPAETPVVLYQGAFRVEQGIEELLRAIREPVLRDRELAVVFLGFGFLEDELRTAASHDRRISVLPPVPSGELLDWTSGASVAFVGTPPKTVNQRMTTPNKLFESLMAGVPVVVAAGTATADLVRGAEVGITVDPWTPPALAQALADLLDRPDELERLRRNAKLAALDRFNWETEREALIALYERVGAEVR
jgi:glycosyltransferase involved in cell wall biosynthesis